MSLDVYLKMPGVSVSCQQTIFVREDGQTREMSRKEWDGRYPNCEPVTEEGTDEVFSANITHNLSRMAEEAKIYKHLWRPNDLGITKAQELIEPLTKGIVLMRHEPERFKALNPKNGWGSYEDFIPWIERYISACCDYPNADVFVSG